ncbi:hypothetical protein B0A55_02972 [Friedmanniomyces simplex]|uniref:Uncharacterized protein n=1 Tax=Friedmanniomyces simplex TaxID=329884 RepID=A0A4U0Y1H5_9PEZI|nr:hypothetical protein B0A55_02972 [Friedmanniomyces simplex]
MTSTIIATHTPASATSPIPLTILMCNMHPDWCRWPEREEMFFDPFVTPAVTEFSDRRHQQWYKTDCLRAPRRMLSVLQRVSLPVVITESGKSSSLGPPRLLASSAPHRPSFATGWRRCGCLVEVEEAAWVNLAHCFSLRREFKYGAGGFNIPAMYRAGVGRW